MPLFWRRTALILGDWILLYLALACALTLRHMEPVSLGFYLRHAAAFTALFPFWMAVFYVLGLYDFRRMQTLVTLANDSALAIVINLMVSMGWLYMLPDVFGLAPKTHLLMTAILGHCWFALWRHIWVRIYSKKVAIQRVAFLGEHPLIPMIRAELEACAFYGMRCVPCPDLSVLEARSNTSAYWHPTALAAEDLRFDADILVVVADEVERRPELGRTILSVAVAKDIPVRGLLDFYEETFHKVPPEFAARSRWLLNNVLHKANDPYMYAKRAVDVVFSIAGLLLTTPIFALAAVIARGSPFYTQKRLGYHGQVFRIWKLRTMVHAADEKGPFLGSGDADPRVTRFGRFLRRLRLDELPQLWNVLKGDMSLVGPRPEWVDEVVVLEEKVPHYHLRHLVKPGITGWAQVNFRATNSVEDSLEKLHYDLYYVKNLSFALDIGILLKTLKRIFVDDRSIRRGPARLVRPVPSGRPDAFGPGAVGVAQPATRA